MPAILNEDLRFTKSPMFKICGNVFLSPYHQNN